VTWLSTYCFLSLKRSHDTLLLTHWGNKLHEVLATCFILWQHLLISKSPCTETSVYKSHLASEDEVLIHFCLGTAPLPNHLHTILKILSVTFKGHAMHKHTPATDAIICLVLLLCCGVILGMQEKWAVLPFSTMFLLWIHEHVTFVYWMMV
jgi:hypothetical protein